MSEPTGPPPSGPPPSGPPPRYPPPPPPFRPPPGPGWPPPPPIPPRPRALLVVVLAVLLAAVVVVAALVVPGLGDDADASGSTADEPSAEVEANLDDVQVYEPEPSHDNGELDYPQSPPVGGPHNDIWLDCGVYDEPVPEEHVVHDLEHGTVWLTYEPGLDDEQVEQLEDALPQNGILSPYDGLRAPVVVTVWGRQLDLTGADDPRLGLFIEEFSDGVTAPEASASCAGGATLEQLETLGRAV